MPKFSSSAGFDAGVAAFAALSAGFVVFAMPGALFSSLVEASRLPDFVAAAQPPLGDTARFAAAGAAALFTFAAVWALMAVLDRAPARRPAVAEPEAEAPRLRRADAHPDAPARRPLLARDLGEPLELDKVAEVPAEETPFAEADLRPLPGFLVPQESDSEAEAEAAEPETQPEPHWIEPEPEPELVADARSEPEAEPRPIAALAAELPEAEPETEASLSQLVNRIEFGLSRKRQALPAAEQPAAEEAPAEQERVGHRLRGAINDLQKLASGGV